MGLFQRWVKQLRHPDHNISASSSLYNIPALIISGCKSYVNAVHGNRPEQAWAYACTFAGCFLNFLHNFGYDGKKQTTDDLLVDQAMPGQEVRFSSSSSSICNPVKMILSRESSTIIALSAVAITFYESVKHMGESHKAMSSLMASAVISAGLRLGLYFHQTELDKRHQNENSCGKS